MDEFYKQILAPMTDIKEKEKLLNQTTFMTKITDSVLANMSSYHDSVREEGQALLLHMT